MLPKLASALSAWQQEFSFSIIRKSIVNYEIVEKKTLVNFRGVVAPLSARQLELKAEGQRAWRWFEIHSTAELDLKPDDVVTWKCKQYRVMAAHDWSDYGYWRYEIAEQFTA